MKRTQLGVQNQTGFTLLELLAGVALVSITSLAVMTVGSMVGKSSQSTAMVNGAMSSYVALLATIENPTAWKNTTNANGSMACLQAHTDCTGVAGGAVVVYDQSGQVFFDPTSANNGFNLRTAKCSTYTSATDASCFYHYDVTWKPICSGTPPCIDPLVSVGGVLHIAPRVATTSGTLSTQKYSFTKVLGYKKNYDNRACESLAGTFDLETKQCKFAPKALHCPAGQVVSGLDLQGNVSCAPAATGRCTSGQGVAGFNKDGSVMCMDRSIASVTPTSFTGLTPGACPQVSPPKNQFEVWQVANGSHRIAVPCAGSIGPVTPSTPVQYRIYDDWLQVSCQASQVVPTGVTSSTPRNVPLEGACPVASAQPVPPSTPVSPTCPNGVAVNGLFWGPASNSADTIACPSDLSKSATRNYQVQSQYICNATGNGTYSTPTGVENKTLISQSSCPGSCNDDQVATKDPQTGLVSCQAFVCNSFQPIASFPAVIPARGGDHVCYYKKIFSAIPFSTSIDPHNLNMYARNHNDGKKSNWNPLTMGSASLEFMIEGPRAVKLAGGISTTTPIIVDNFLTTGRRSHEESQLLNDWAVNGTQDSTVLNYRDGTYVQVFGQDVRLKAFATTGTATVRALMLSQFGLYRSYIADIFAMDCGGFRQLSDVYLVFQ